MSESLFEFLSQFVSEQRLRRFEEVLSYRTRHLTLVLENVHHAHNASACLRTCDCFGIQDVHIVESLNSFEPNPEISLGSSQWLTIQRHQSTVTGESTDVNVATAECFTRLRDDGYRILATSPRQDSVPLNAVTVDAKTAIVFGAEQLGVSDFGISEADALIHIPMYGFTESFNISVSAAIVLQKLTTQLHSANVAWKLSDAEKQVLRELWVRESLGERVAPLCRRFEQEQQAE